MAWISPDRVRECVAPGTGPVRRALGVKRHAPRLAARQRGILAFMPLTVVGPGRLLVADEAARVRPGDEVASPIARRCRSRSPPSRRLMNAPLVEWIGMGRMYEEINSLSRTISLMENKSQPTSWPQSAIWSRRVSDLRSSASFALRSGYAYMLPVEPFSGPCANDRV